ncbi:MAG: chromosome segregation protein SMC [Clostridia bacterium]|nr:chromosome segregation protein SMC [Clostridia bacterium]
MRLLSLELHGFKSFPQRTKIKIDPGMTIIVGPNGSGKSNISDAVKWVLGELSSKNIRGTKMEDVIFGGTEHRPAMGFAEVSMTIDNRGENRINSEFDEITVTRRYFRTGDSQYLINNKQVRLKDIAEMFMNTGIGKTGYSIIGQGKISEIISQKSDDRRIIFEEAAGISKYRIKKAESEKRLAEAEDNITRLSDIVSHHARRLPSLERDSAKAKAYLEIYEKKKALDVAISVYDIGKILERGAENEKELVVSRNELEIADGLLASLEKRSEQLATSQMEKRIEIERTRTMLLEQEREKNRLETTLTLAGNNKQNASGALSEGEASTRSALAKLEIAENEHTSLIEEKKAITERLSIQSELLNKKSTELDLERERVNSLQGELDSVRDCIDALEGEYNELRVDYSAFGARSSSSDSHTEELSADMEKASAEKKALCEEIESGRSSVLHYEKKAEELRSERAKLLESVEKLESESELIRSEIDNASANAAACRQKADALRRMDEHFDGYQRSVKAVADASAKGQIKGVIGPVSKQISVKRELTLAIETALGSNIQNIIVENENAAKSAIEYLKRENAGRATFYPLTSIKAQKLSADINLLKRKAGYIGVADELVKCDERCRAVISYLLGRTVVFDTLDNASVTAKELSYSVRIVTLDGQLINAGGSFTGGAAKRDSGILTRGLDIAKLDEDESKALGLCETLRKKLADIKRSSDELEGEIESNADSISMLSSLISAGEASISLRERSLAELELRISEISEKLGEIEKERSERSARALEMKSRISELETLIKEKDASALRLESEIESVNRSIATLASEKSEIFVNVSVSGKELENAESRILRSAEFIASVKKDIEDLDLRMHEINERIKELESEADETKDAIVLADRKIKELEELLEKLSGDGDEYEKEINLTRNTIKEKTHERELVFMTLTRLEAASERIREEKERLTDRLWDDYSLSYADASLLEYPATTDENRPTMLAEQNILSAKMKELGNVHIGAIEEYAAVKKEYDFMSGQIEDLQKAKADCVQVIARLEKEMRGRFAETFEKINENFSKVFRDLFGGGSASLTLTDPDNLLTSGIDINVAPPGKKIHNLRQLSGGEQSFIAIAIYFAIIMINPPPFCLLDEIESALDDVNVTRFANYAKRFSDKVQFIIITHRRGTMEAADEMYGVTMQERGVSQLLSVNLSEIEKKLGVKI